MASTFRSSSPVRTTDRPKAAFLGPGNNGLRKSFNVNVLPKAPPRNNLSTFTPANSPADYPQRASPFKDFSGPARHSDGIGVENVRPGAPKSATGKSPAPKSMKNFMAPTFSAASKATSPRKKILGERNEPAAPSPSIQTPAKTPSKSPSVVVRPHFVDVLTSCEPMVEDNHKVEEAPMDFMEVDQVQSEPQPESNNVCRVLFDAPDADEGSDSLSYLAQFPDPGDECTTHLPPYDPKRNYLSPRPDFLRYCPNRGLDIDSTEFEEGFGRNKFFNSENPLESGVTEVKEVETLGEQMAAVGIYTNDLGNGEIHDEVQTKMGLFENSKERLFNPEPHLGFELEKNALEEMEPRTSDVEEDDEEEQKQSSGWLRASLLFAFVLLCASVAVMSSGSPGLLPPYLHNNALTRGEFYGSAVDVAKGVEVFWRRGFVKDVGLSVLGYSRTNYEVIVKNVKGWLGSSETKAEMPAKSSMEDVLQNFFQNIHTRETEETDAGLGMEINVDNDIKREILLSELLEGSVSREDLKVEESNREAAVEGSVSGDDHEGEGSNGEANVETFDPILVDNIAHMDVQIPSVDVGSLDNVQVHTDLDVLWEKNPELPLSSELVEEKSSAGAYESEDSIAFTSSYSGIISSPEETLSFSSDIEEEKDALSRTDYSLPDVQSEQTHSVNKQQASEGGNLSEIPEAILISNQDGMLASAIPEDFPFNEEGALNTQSRASATPTGEGQSHHVSQPDRDDKAFAKEFKSTESNEPMISEIIDSVLEEDLKGSDLQASARRSAREILLSGTAAGVSILVAAAIAAIYFASASRKSSKFSSEVVAVKPAVEFIAKKQSQRGNYSPPIEPMEKPYSGKFFSSHKISPPHVQFLTEHILEEVNSSDRYTSRMNAQDNAFQTYDRRFRGGNSFSSATSLVTSDFSTDSPSYGSFTTYEKIARKEGGGYEEPKVMKVVTPVRRSSRIQKKQAMSPE